MKDKIEINLYLWGFIFNIEKANWKTYRLFWKSYKHNKAKEELKILNPNELPIILWIKSESLIINLQKKYYDK